MNGLGITGGGYTGTGYTGDVLIYGNLLVTGGIDPTYLALTSQASGPQGFINPLWLDNNSFLRSEKIWLSQDPTTASLYTQMGNTGLVATDATGLPQYTASVSAGSSILLDTNGASTTIQSTQIQLTDSSTLTATISNSAIVMDDPPNTTSTTYYNDGFASSNPSVNAPYIITGGYIADDGFTSITTDPTDPNNPNESAQLRGAGGLKLQTNNWSQPPDAFSEEVILTSGGKDSIANNTPPRLEFNHIGDQDTFRYRVNGSDVAFMADGSWVFLENVGVTIYGTTAQRIAQFYQGFLGFYDNIGVASNIKIDPKNATSGKPDITLTDGTTSNTINQNGYTTRNTNANATHYLNFSDSSSTGVGAIQKTAGISCNPSTNVITATTFSGALSGTATLTSQITLPITTAASFAAGTGTLTCNFGSFSTGVFSATLTANMTAISFSSPRTGGQYVIYVTVASGGPFTIASTFTGARTNYTTPVLVTTTTTALLTVTHDGTRYIIGCSAYI